MKRRFALVLLGAVGVSAALAGLGSAAQAAPPSVHAGYGARSYSAFGLNTPNFSGYVDGRHHGASSGWSNRHGYGYGGYGYGGHHYGARGGSHSW